MIGSATDLDNLQVGATIMVATVTGSSRHRWTKDADGTWVFNTSRLTSDMLDGLAKAGAIIDESTVIPMPGEWWTARAGVIHRIISVDLDARTARCLVIHPTARSMEFRNIELDRYVRYTRLDDVPERLVAPEMVGFLVEAYLSAMDSVRFTEERLRVMKNRPDPEQLRPQILALRQALDTLAAQVG